MRDLNLANVNVTANPGVTFQTVGTLAGTNLGTVSGVTADGTVNGGTVTDAVLGGLVGANGWLQFRQPGPGQITNSHVDVDVSSAGINVALGGLVGFNAPGSIIFGSSASGDVIATATVNQGGQGCGFGNSCQHVSAGGLVGENFGTIAFSLAIGDVFVGSNGTAGGLVGFNTGVIANAFAAGNVTGAPGSGGVDGDGGSTTLGGLVGINQGVISNSVAIGDVGGANVANLQAGGLVGDNSGAILSSTAFGNVQAGDDSNGRRAGRLQFGQQLQLLRLHARRRLAVLQHRRRSSTRTRSATSRSARRASPADSWAAGDGLIANSTAFGNVLGGGNSVLGRLHRRAELRERRRRDLILAVRRDQSPAPDPTASSADSPA